MVIVHGGLRHGGAHQPSTVVTSRERPSSGEATSVREEQARDGEEGKIQRRDRQETRDSDKRQQDKSRERDRETETVSPPLTVCSGTRNVTLRV